jgi:sulfur relay (sulfurtransferase) complex TusBCD TusD component (DsrE family)
MTKAYTIVGVLALAIGLFAGVVISGQIGEAAFAQDATETPAPEEEAVEANETALPAESGTMTETVQAVLDNINAAEESLFVNLTTDDLAKAAMAINFSHKVLNDRNIPVSIFLNVEGVRLADTTVPQPTHVTGQTIAQKLEAFMADGGTVLVCPFCMQNVGGVAKDELMEGVLMGVPELTQGALFADNATVLSY